MTTKLINLKDIIHIDGLTELVYQFAKKPDKTYYSNHSKLFKHLHYFCAFENNQGIRDGIYSDGVFIWGDKNNHNKGKLSCIYNGLNFNSIVYPKQLKIYNFNI